MPYIHESKRSYLKGYLSTLGPHINFSGTLNYVLTKIVWAYWRRSQDYQAINDILGALDGVGKEFYRRVAVPYENSKLAENGDVYASSDD